MKSYYIQQLAYSLMSLRDIDKEPENTIKDKITANPMQRDVLSKLPNTGKRRKKNTHLKRSKKRK